MREQIVYLSAPARIALALIVAFVFLCSASLVAYLLWTHPSGRENIVAAGIALANTAATGLGFIVVLLMSRLTADVDDLRAKTDRFLLDELPDAFRTIDFVAPGFSSGKAPRLDDATRVKLEISFVRGTNYGNYRVEGFGLVQNVNVMLNVKRMVVSYAFPADYPIEAEQTKAAFGYVIDGAVHAGYQMEWREMGGEDDKRIELRCFVNLKDDFLSNGLERLFWSSDVAIMTRSVMRARKNCETASQKS